MFENSSRQEAHASSLSEEELLEFQRRKLLQQDAALEAESLPDVVTGQPEWEDGYLLPPDRPGLGIEFDREAAKRYPFEPTELPKLRRIDGSFTNW